MSVGDQKDNLLLQIQLHLETINQKLLQLQQATQQYSNCGENKQLGLMMIALTDQLDTARDEVLSGLVKLVKKDLSDRALNFEI